MTEEQVQWLKTLESFHPHTGYDAWKCDKCGEVGKFSDERLADQPNALNEWVETHFTGKCSNG